MQKFQSEMIKLGTQLLNKGDAINKPSIDQGLMSTHAVINFLPAYHYGGKHRKPEKDQFSFRLKC